MADDPLSAVFSFVERAYVRLQAGDVLTRCLDEGDPVPIQRLVEELVLVGPGSLGALREILTEVSSRKAQLQEDLHQMFSELEKRLKNYGVSLTGLHTPISLAYSGPISFAGILGDQGVADPHTQVECLQLVQNSQELMVSLASRLHLLEEIEIYLRDWLWGLIYQSARQELTNGLTSSMKNRWTL